MADRVSRTARSSSTMKISPLDEPSSVIFPTPHRGKAELDHVATTIPLGATTAPSARPSSDMAHHRKAIASGTACAIVGFHGAYTHTRLQTQEKFRTAGLSATAATGASFATPPSGS